MRKAIISAWFDGGSQTLKYIYLIHGVRADITLQLKYSLYSLIRWVPDARGNIVLYTDLPERYQGWPVQVIALSAVTSQYTKPITYHFLFKLLVLLHAQRHYDAATVFIDADTFVLPGFDADLFWKLETGAILNTFEMDNPFPQLAGFSAALPHMGTYLYDPERSIMYNSGIIGLPRRQCALIEDAMALTEALLTQDLKTHTAEQFAMSEAMRLHGFSVRECDHYLVHYHRRSLKRYVTWKLKGILPAQWDDFDVRRPLRLNSIEKALFDLQYDIKLKLGQPPKAVEIERLP